MEKMLKVLLSVGLVTVPAFKAVCSESGPSSYEIAYKAAVTELVKERSGTKNRTDELIAQLKGVHQICQETKELFKEVQQSTLRAKVLAEVRARGVAHEKREAYLAKCARARTERIREQNAELLKAQAVQNVKPLEVKAVQNTSLDTLQRARTVSCPETGNLAAFDLAPERGVSCPEARTAQSSLLAGAEAFKRTAAARKSMTAGRSTLFGWVSGNK